jgi:hypothetical protein
MMYAPKTGYVARMTRWSLKITNTPKTVPTMTSPAIRMAIRMDAFSEDCAMGMVSVKKGRIEVAPSLGTVETS